MSIFSCWETGTVDLGGVSHPDRAASRKA